LPKKIWFTRHETVRFLNNHCQECVRAYLSIHDCLSFLHEVMIGNHRPKTFLHEIGTKWNITSKHDNNSERIVMNLYDTHKSVSSMCNTNMYGRFNLQNTCHIFCSIFLQLPVFKVILHQFWVKKIFPWKFKLELLSYSCMFQVEICSHQLEICKSVCMFIVLAIIVETD
jgi:hypothetical protein